jgi:mannose-6-phosphate isomerase-like protein (cupin superfamily)
VAEHDHDAQWEVLLAIRAKGTLEVRAPGKPGEADAVQSLEVGAGTIVTMPAGVRHAWKPDGTEPLLALQLYVPPGPEQRFKKLAQTR